MKPVSVAGLVVNAPALLRLLRSPLCLVLVGLPACAGDDSAPPPADAASDGGCVPQLAAGFSPVWRPPQATPGACADGQIDDQYRLCESASGDPVACAAFNRDPANARCRNCLYSTDDESSYGPLIYLKNRVLSVNVPGCMALADGNLGASGCGAQVQAFESCKDDACFKTCATFEGFQQCIGQAASSVCLPYIDDSACKEPSTYTACLDNATFEEFFRKLSKIFCGSGFPGGGMPEGGVGPDSGSDAATLLVPGTVASRMRGIPADALRTRVTGGSVGGLSR